MRNKEFVADPDHPDYDPHLDPELLAEVQPVSLRLKDQPVRGLHCGDAVALWASFEDVESTLGVKFEHPDTAPHFTLIPGGGK